MTKFKKIIAYVLLLFTTIPVSSISGMNLTSAQEHIAPSTNFRQLTVPKPDYTQKIELEDQKTMYSNTYLLPDGTKQKEIFSEPVNYQDNSDQSKKWKKIDTKFTENKDETTPKFLASSNNFALSLSGNITDEGVSLTKNKSKINMTLESVRDINKSSKSSSFYPNSFSKKNAANAKVVNDENKVTYEAVYPNTNIIYYSTRKGLKEDIKLEKYNGQNIFYFNLNLANLTFSKEGDGSYNFFDGITKDLVFTIPKIIMWDSKGGENSAENEYSDNVETNILPGIGNLTMEIKINDSWLKDSSRVYPVTIDPTIVSSLGYGEDTYVQEGYPSLNMNVNADLYVGKHPTKRRTRALIPFYFENLTNAKIYNATFSTLQTYCSGAGSSTDAGVSAFVTSDYNYKTVNWYTQPKFIGTVGYSANNATNSIIKIDVTNALKSWFNDGNPTGSKIGSFGFVDNDETRSGYRIWVAENNPTSSPDNEPKLVINYTDYDGAYAAGNIPSDVLVDDELAVPMVAANYARATWSASNTRMSYHIYDSSNALVTWDGIRSNLPSDISYGKTVNFESKIKLPSKPGYYTIKWDMVKDDGTWFSTLGIPTFNQFIYVNDYPEYSAFYSNYSFPASSSSGDSVAVPITIYNGSRYAWETTTYKVGYHWYDNKSGKYIYWGISQTSLPSRVPERTGTINMVMNVKIPILSGSYTLKIDMYSVSQKTWFSNKGVLTGDKTTTVSPSSISALIHSGTRDYYPKTGVVDLATGALTFAVNDMSVPSKTTSMDFLRTYNSVDSNPTFPSDSKGLIKKWLFNGPYYGNDHLLAFNTQYITNESGIKPSTASVSGSNPWYQAEYSGTGTYMDLDKVLDDAGVAQYTRADGGGLYAHVYVYSPVDKELNFKILSSGGIKLWLNSSSIFQSLYGTDAGTTKTITQSLRKGWNSLSVKLSMTLQYKTLGISIVNKDGTLPLELKYCLNNPDIFGNSGVMGKGWITSLDEKLDVSDKENIYYRDATGSIDLYTKKTDGSYQRPAGIFSDLSLDSWGNFQLIDRYGGKTSFLSDGSVSEKIDRFGNSVVYTYIYSSDGARLGVKYMSGGMWRDLGFSYYPDGTLKNVYNDKFMNGDLYKEEYVYYYVNQQLVKVVDPVGNFASYSYDSSGRMIGYTDKKGNLSKINYSAGKVASLIDPLNNSTTFRFVGSKVTITDALKRISSAVVSKLNLVTSFTDAKSYTESYQYNNNYQVTTITPTIATNDRYYYKWSYTYDTNGNLLSVKDPQGGVDSYSYNQNDLVKHVDANGNISTLSYSTDKFRLPILATNPEGGTQKYEYSSFFNGFTGWKNLKTAETDAKGNITKYGYSNDGDLISITSSEGNTTQFENDIVGRKISETSALGNKTKFTYDKMFRLISITNPDGKIVKCEYDQNGNLIKETNVNGGIKKYEYNSLDQLTRTIDEAGAVVQYFYDAVGNKIKMIDAGGNSTSYAYDELNQLISETDPGTATSTANYDRNGNLTKITNPDGSALDYQANNVGDVQTISSKEAITKISYNKLHEVIKTATTLSNGGTESSSASYNKNGWITQVNSSTFGNLTNAYDKNNNLTVLNSSVANYSFNYNKLDNLSTISTTLTATGAALAASTLNWDAEGKLSSITKSNGDKTNYSYGKTGSISKVVNATSANVVQNSYSYTYDALMNPLKIIDNKGVSKSYVYDARGQLISDEANVYKYNAIGNKTSKISGGLTTAYSYDSLIGDNNRLQKVSNPDGSTVIYAYDKNGNIISSVDSKLGATKYYYDSENYFVKAELPNGNTIRYEYDTVSKLRVKRIEKTKAGTETITKFIYDGSRLIAETDNLGKPTIIYTWDERENLIAFSIPIGSSYITYNYLKNARNDVTAIADSTGKIVATYDYDSWGKIKLSKTESSSTVTGLDKINPRLFASYWYDKSLNLYFMKTRMYDPSLGRFLSKDVISSGSSALDQNPYIYCRNNPLANVDPSGNQNVGVLDDYLSDTVGYLVEAGSVLVKGAVTGAVVAVSWSAGWRAAEWLEDITRPGVRAIPLTDVNFCPAPNGTGKTSPPGNRNPNNPNNKKKKVRVSGTEALTYGNGDIYGISFVSLNVGGDEAGKHQILHVSLEAHPFDQTARFTGFQNDTTWVPHMNINVLKLRNHIVMDPRRTGIGIVGDWAWDGEKPTKLYNFRITF